MKGLTLFNPHALLMSLNAKRIETRSWTTPYRGPIAIHVSLGFPSEQRALIEQEPFKSVLAPYLHNLRQNDWECGSIIAAGELVGIIPTNRLPLGSGQISFEDSETGQLVTAELTEQERAFGDYSANRYAWIFENIRPLGNPIPWMGNRGLWTIHEQLEARIRAQLGVAA